MNQGLCLFVLVQTWDPEEPQVPGRRASLSDLSCLDDIEALSVRQLKEILCRNFVDYKGCCEKWELMERVTRLYQDQQNLLGESPAASVPVIFTHCSYMKNVWLFGCLFSVSFHTITRSRAAHTNEHFMKKITSEKINTNKYKTTL